MVFTPASWLPALPHIPDVPIHEILLNEKYGRASLDTSLDAYVCGISGKAITATEQKWHVEILARAIASEMGWGVNEGSEFDKVVGVFAQNTASYSCHLHLSSKECLTRNRSMFRQFTGQSTG